jgi:hypothetical protein
MLFCNFTNLELEKAHEAPHGGIGRQMNLMHITQISFVWLETAL